MHLLGKNSGRSFLGMSAFGVLKRGSISDAPSCILSSILDFTGIDDVFTLWRLHHCNSQFKTVCEHRLSNWIQTKFLSLDSGCSSWVKWKEVAEAIVPYMLQAPCDPMTKIFGEVCTSMWDSRLQEINDGKDAGDNCLSYNSYLIREWERLARAAPKMWKSPLCIQSFQNVMSASYLDLVPDYSHFGLMDVLNALCDLPEDEFSFCWKQSIVLKVFVESNTDALVKYWEECVQDEQRDDWFLSQRLLHFNLLPRPVDVAREVARNQLSRQQWLQMRNDILEGVANKEYVIPWRYPAHREALEHCEHIRAMLLGRLKDRIRLAIDVTSLDAYMQKLRPGAHERYDTEILECLRNLPPTGAPDMPDSVLFTWFEQGPFSARFQALIAV